MGLTFQVESYGIFLLAFFFLFLSQGVNHWVHDVEVTNRDECVTVKVCSVAISVKDCTKLINTLLNQTPASNFLIERIWCNQSGGSAIGSLTASTAIENIVYRNVYTWVHRPFLALAAPTTGISVAMEGTR